MSKFTRRLVLKGVTAGAITLSFAGVVQAWGRTRYLGGGKGRGLRKRVERAGYTVEHVLADGRVLLVTGPDGSEDDLKDVKGVEHAAQDVLFRLEQPERLLRGHVDGGPAGHRDGGSPPRSGPERDSQATRKGHRTGQGAESVEGESKAELGAGRLNVANALEAPVLN